MIIVNTEPLEVQGTFDGNVIDLLREGYSYDDAIIEAKYMQSDAVTTVSHK